ncbi:MAG TPA: phage tail protein [Azospirillum sp.]|nr:phage tail protein [Azospirillum sp.]
MALLVFAPPIAPLIGSTLKAQPKVLTASFGDNYSQRAADGLHAAQGLDVGLSWEGLPAQIAEIEAFLESTGGYKAFLYQVPGRTTPQAWTCPGGWERVANTLPGIDKLSVTLKRVFDLA